MYKIAKLISKLNLLGSTTIKLSDKALISIDKTKDRIVCYSINEDEMLSKVYDMVLPINDLSMRETNYIVGFIGTNCDILDKGLVIKSKYYNEVITNIINDRYVIVFRPLSSTYRLTSIDGKEYTKGIVFNLEVYGVDTGVVCKCSQADDKGYILRISDTNVVSTLRTDGAIYIIIGSDVTALVDQYNSIQIYDNNNKLKLSIKNGKIIREETKGSSLAEEVNVIYKVLDQYGYEVTRFNSTSKLRRNMICRV